MPDLQDEILTLLGDHRIHTDESLAEKLNVTRSLIADQRELLSAVGLHLDFQDDRGYRLPTHIELLSKDSIHEYLL